MLMLRLCEPRCRQPHTLINDTLSSSFACAAVPTMLERVVAAYTNNQVVCGCVCVWVRGCVCVRARVCVCVCVWQKRGVEHAAATRCVRHVCA